MKLRLTPMNQGSLLLWGSRSNMTLSRFVEKHPKQRNQKICCRHEMTREPCITRIGQFFHFIRRNLNVDKTLHYDPKRDGSDHQMKDHAEKSCGNQAIITAYATYAALNVTETNNTPKNRAHDHNPHRLRISDKALEIVQNGAFRILARAELARPKYFRVTFFQGGAFHGNSSWDNHYLAVHRNWKKSTIGPQQDILQFHRDNMIVVAIQCTKKDENETRTIWYCIFSNFMGKVHKSAAPSRSTLTLWISVQFELSTDGTHNKKDQKEIKNRYTQSKKERNTLGRALWQSIRIARSGISEKTNHLSQSSK